MSDRSGRSSSDPGAGLMIESCKEHALDSGNKDDLSECEHPDMEQEHRDDILLGNFEAIL